MSVKVDFKYGSADNFSKIEAKEEGTIYAVNDAFAETPGDEKLGSIYRGDKIVGTTKASELRTTEDIIVTEGSPIDALGIFDGNVIPAGTSLEDFIKKLISKEVFPEVKKTANGSFSVTLGNPSISASVSNGAIVEAGSTVTFNTIKSGADTISKSAAKVGAFTYGYKDTKTGEVIKPSNNELVSDWTSTPSGNYKIECSVSKFSALGTSSAEGETQDDAKIEAQTVTVAAGTNKLTVTNTGRTYAATRPAIGSKFVVSNSNTVSDDEKSPEVAGVSQDYSDSNGSSASFSVEGIYPAYYGTVTSANPTESDLKGMTKLVKKKQNLVVSGPFDNVYMCVACPPGWTIAKAVDSNGFDNTNSLVSKTVEITCLDGTKQNYNVYLIGPSTQGSGFTMTFN